VRQFILEHQLKLFLQPPQLSRRRRLLDKMADLQTPSGAAIGTIDARASTPVSNKGKPSTQPTTKPEKPDEERYKSDLSKAEKEHSNALDRLV
jgi:hypothetical protein